MNRFQLLALSAALLLAPACSSNPPDEQPGPDASVPAGPDASQPVPVTCTLVSPAADALVTGTVEVKVEFQGPATKIEILDGDSVAASADVTASPATISLDTTKLSEGAHTLKAKASSAEASGESAAVAIVTDNKAPALNLGLMNMAFLEGPAAVVPIVVTEVHVAKVQLLEADTVLVDLTAIPDDILWDTTKVADGLHTVKLSVTDTVGHTTVSPEKKIIVGNHATIPAITYLPAALVTVPENWQTVEIDVRGMVTNPGSIKHIITWLQWDPAALPTPINFEYSVGEGLCPHRGIKFIGKESTEGEIVLDLKRSEVPAEAEAKFPAGSDTVSFPFNTDPETLGSFFGHIAIMDAADHVGQSLPIKMYFVLFTE
ncbi:MAG TPA: Ig-like domain-containing protein [Myxococcales bacterium]